MTYRRYTTLPILLDTIINRRITIVGYQTWEDINDRRSLDIYKEHRPDVSFLGALCLTKEKNPTFHHWKIYAGDSSGVCIIFKDVNFDSMLDGLDKENFNFGNVRYVAHKGSAQNIEEGFQKKFDKIDIENIPFIKRLSFKAENEFRIVYKSSDKNQRFVNIDIDLEMIEKVILSPFMHVEIARSVKSVIQGLVGVNFDVEHSTVTNSSAWQRALAIYAARGELENA